AGMTVTRQQVVLDRAIKMLGLEPIRIVLHPEVAVTVTANIARTSEEADRQMTLGRAVGTGDEMVDDEGDREHLRAEARSMFRPTPNEPETATNDPDENGVQAEAS
ncbi:MAG: 50S ribosomal protein L9, partial [Alphaproteobacteria bacterium]|nr:50S ribosomal protein L9 [Alphaproteobacteria bacterium]